MLPGHCTYLGGVGALTDWKASCACCVAVQWQTVCLLFLFGPHHHLQAKHLYCHLSSRILIFFKTTSKAWIWIQVAVELGFGGQQTPEVCCPLRPHAVVFHLWELKDHPQVASGLIYISDNSAIYAHYLLLLISSQSSAPGVALVHTGHEMG